MSHSTAPAVTPEVWALIKIGREFAHMHEDGKAECTRCAANAALRSLQEQKAEEQDG